MLSELVDDRATWGPLWGGGFGSIEGWLAMRRVRAPLPGLFLAGTLGAGIIPNRLRGGVSVGRGRADLWLGLGVGWSGRYRRLLGRLAWHSRATFLPVQKIGDSAGALSSEEAGWIVFSTGPTGGIGLDLGHRIAAVVTGTLQGTALATDEDEVVRPRFFGVLSLALEVTR